jgi:hypothetical protein
MFVRRALESAAAGAAILAFVFVAVREARAQTPAYATASAFTSTSGVVTLGFASGRLVADDAALPSPLRHVDAPPAGRQLIARMLRSSPTFRRQCARLAHSGVPVRISFDFDPRITHSYAQSTITRTPALQARVRLRGGPLATPEHLAHEFEHILEFVDEVDLPRAVADRVHGARLVERPLVFETARAIAVGRIVAAEMLNER